MRIVTFDELPDRSDAERALIHLAAFSGTLPRRHIELARRVLGRTSDYVGVFAVDGSQLLGQVFVLRIPYVFREGRATVSGIAGVATRPDRARRGVARRLLETVERLEHEAGIEYSSLWTNASWGAHRLYEELGYRDIYSSPWALDRTPGTAPPRPREPPVRSARVADVDEIDRLHDRLAAGRLGFCDRPAGFGRAMVDDGSVDPSTQLLVAEVNGELRGYAHLDRGIRRTICGELMARSPPVRRALVNEMARRSAGRPLAFHHTPVTDAPELFAGRRFEPLPRSWHVLMGKVPGKGSTAAATRRRFATDDPRFLCLAGDRF